LLCRHNICHCINSGVSSNYSNISNVNIIIIIIIITIQLLEVGCNHQLAATVPQARWITDECQNRVEEGQTDLHPLHLDLTVLCCLLFHAVRSIILIKKWF
jgi:hypothetical protein